jgi:hypothetical protein
MKKFFTIAALGLLALPLSAQQDVKRYDQKSLYETLTKVEKKSDRFNFYLNMHSSFNAGWDGDEFSSAAFKMDQLRLEAKGNINDWISYRWRQRLNRSNNGSGTQDNLSSSIDYAGVGFKVTPDFQIFAGKQCASYGGIEFDLNPIEIYQYSDMIDYLSNFMTGVNLIYNAVPTQQICFQVLDSRSAKFDEIYPNPAANIESSKASLVYTLNWNGAFLDNAIKTRWSASYMSEAREKLPTDKFKNRSLWYYALGTEFNLGPVNAFFDWMYSRESLDRLGIVSNIVGGNAVSDTKYMSYVWKINYRVAPKWNLFVKGMIENEGTYRASVNDHQTVDKGKFRTAYGYLGGIEYYPMKENLHFFLTYIGRSYDYTKATRQFGTKDYSTNTLSLGFIYQLQMF